jgi:hypothetical protein
MGDASRMSEKGRKGETTESVEKLKPEMKSALPGSRQ